MQTMETDGVDGVRPGHWSDGATITHKANSDGTEANVWRPGDEDAAPLEPEPEPEPEPAVSGRAGGEGSATLGVEAVGETAALEMAAIAVLPGAENGAENGAAAAVEQPRRAAGGSGREPPASAGGGFACCGSRPKKNR